MGSVFTCKLNPCCGDRYNCEPPRQYSDPEPALASVPAPPPSGAEPAYWAIHSKSGSHIGLWQNEDIARDILREYEGGTITPLYAGPQAVPAEDIDREDYALLEQFHKEVWGWLISRDLVDPHEDEWPGFKHVIEEHEDEIEAEANRRAEKAEAEATSLRRKLEECERIGKMMANAIYNVHQRGLHVNADDMDSLKECQEAWDRALSGGA